MNTNITIDNTNYRVRISRLGLLRSRRFSYKKFGGYKQAYITALEYAKFLKNCTIGQFIDAQRHVGRPKKSEFFGTNKLILA